MKLVSRRVSMMAALLATSAALASPVNAAEGTAREALDAAPGKSLEASARQRSRELNRDHVLRGVGHGPQAKAELARGQASAGEIVRAADRGAAAPASGRAQ